MVRTARSVRVLVGFSLWTGAAIGAGWLAHSAADGAFPVVSELVSSVTDPPPRFEVRYPRPVPARAGDRVYVNESGGPRAVGEVTAVRAEPGGGCAVVVAAFPECAALIDVDAAFDLVASPRDAAEILQLLFDERTMPVVRAEVDAFLAAHESAFRDRLWPLLRKSWTEYYTEIEADLEKAVVARRDRLEAAFRRHFDPVARKDLAPLVRDRVWPAIQTRCEAEFSAIGAELVEAAPKMKIGFLALWQSLPGTANDHVERAFREFLNSDGAAILNRHETALVAGISGAFDDMAADDRLHALVRSVATDFVNDDETQTVVNEVLLESIIDNPKTPAFLSRLKDAPEVRALAADIWSDFEPHLYRIANALLLDPAGERINPAFARVLRSEVFQKQDRWFLVTPGKPGARPAASGTVFVGRRAGGAP
ncbi:MAG: hypothetical protein HY719_16775 [Planctomycetes bacterium]|nr:hypothetical protein [Planctomycetota bacterium]